MLDSSKYCHGSDFEDKSSLLLKLCPINYFREHINKRAPLVLTLR